MQKFTILGKQLTEADIKALKMLLAEAKLPSKEIHVAQTVGDPDPNVDDELILLLGTPATCSSADLDSDLAKAANGARRAIWIWPQAADDKELPPAAAKYSYSVIPWNAQKLRAVTADDDVTCFENPAGEPLPTVETDRNLCVEDEEKAKAKAKAK